MPRPRAWTLVFSRRKKKSHVPRMPRPSCATRRRVIAPSVTGHLHVYGLSTHRLTKCGGQIGFILKIPILRMDEIYLAEFTQRLGRSCCEISPPPRQVSQGGSGPPRINTTPKLTGFLHTKIYKRRPWRVLSGEHTVPMSYCTSRAARICL